MFAQFISFGDQQATVLNFSYRDANLIRLQSFQQTSLHLYSFEVLRRQTQSISGDFVVKYL